SVIPAGEEVSINEEIEINCSYQDIGFHYKVMTEIFRLYPGGQVVGYGKGEAEGEEAV
ncbi:MAG: hypothetical protein GX930_06170, partial [Clostridia bacterium]|nr:hypothetical protein [Clostridia bacterium]